MTADERAPWGRVEIAVGLALLVALVTVFAYNVERHAFLVDDAFISFRYADHLVRGEGLVWNPGEPVEGYTNFLWVLLLAATMALGFQPEIASQVMGGLSGAGVLAALLLTLARRYGRRSPLIWVAPFALAASPTFTAWCTSGLETMLFTLLGVLAYAFFLGERQGSRRWFASSLFFALASLTRPEGALLTAVAGLFLLSDLLAKRRPWRDLPLWVAPYVLIVGAHVLWRKAYYGFWLPNTFYAKVGGAQWERGFEYLSAFAEAYRLLYFLPLFLLALLWRPRFENLLFTTLLSIYVTYIAYVGADFMEFRFLVPLLPFVYWLLSDGLERLATLPLPGRAPRYAAWLVTAASAVALVFLTWTREEQTRMTFVGIDALRAYTDTRREEGLYLRSLIDEGRLPDDIVLCTPTAGAVPYYTRWPTIDQLGLNDVEIAHQQVTEDTGLMFAGHGRVATEDYLKRRGVVLFDVLNTILFDEPYDLDEVSSPRIFVDLPTLPLRKVKADEGRYLLFATLVEEEEFRRAFGRLEIIE